MWRGARCVSLDQGCIRMARCLHREERSGKSWSDIRSTIRLLTGWLFCPRWMDYCSRSLMELFVSHPRLPVCLSAAETSSEANLCVFALWTRYRICMCLIPCTVSHLYLETHSLVSDPTETTGSWRCDIKDFCYAHYWIDFRRHQRVPGFFWCVYQLTYSTVQKSQAHSKTWC